MSTSTTIYYADTLLAPTLLDKVRNAKSSIQIMVFLWRTGYAQRTMADDLLDAVIAKQNEGVDVYVLLNGARFEPDVVSENYATGLKLAAAGCAVRMGPRNQTLHTKMSIFDLTDVFIGSHNYTRGAFGFNGEVTVFQNTLKAARWSTNYYNIKWLRSTKLSEYTPPETYVPVAIRLTSATPVGEEIEVGFSVNHVEGVDAFAAVSDSELNLDGANMGATATPETRVARVTPLVAAGQEVYLAVRAYRAGTVEAESNIASMVYQPAESPGGDGEGGGGGGEPPPPEPLTAATVTTVTQATPTTVTVDWTWVGAPDFQRFIIQQRDLQLVWQEIGVVIDAPAREWTGAPNSMDSINPFRVVVYNTASQSATSNEVLLTTPPLTNPHLDSVVAGLNGTEITVTWTFAGSPDFHRFEVQKQVSGQWSAVGSTQDPAARQWVGPGPGTIEPTTYRVVVFNMAEESAASNEVTVAGTMPAVQAPVLVSVTQIGPMGINVEYSHVTPTEFARYEVQQRTNGSWQTLGTITTPETRSWSGGPVAYMDPTHPVRVVVFVQSGDSAGSNEMAITLM